ncbi:MAG: hypothetical protein MK171_08090 [Pirellulales bacterium]|nr:hypothetical protein [Pirellulales bacterium]
MSYLIGCRAARLNTPGNSAVKLLLFMVVGIFPVLPLAASTSAQDRRELERRLRQPVSLTWQGQELGQALMRLATAHQITLWIDRRVDTAQRIDAKLSNRSLLQAFQDIAAQYQLGAVQFGPLVYVGPPHASLELATLSRQARKAVNKISPTRRHRWLKTEPLSWPRLSEPRALLGELLSSAEIRLDHDKAIPHDLWPKQRLPPLSVVDRAVLILIGFDLTCQISQDGKRLTVIPIGRPLVHTNPPATNRPRAKLRPQQVKAQQVYSLKIQNQPIGRVLDQLAGQLELEVSWDQRLVASRNSVRNKIISCEVQNADLDELLQGILAPAGLRFRRENMRITVEASEASQRSD